MKWSEGNPYVDHLLEGGRCSLAENGGSMGDGPGGFGGTDKLP